MTRHPALTPLALATALLALATALLALATAPLALATALLASAPASADERARLAQGERLFRSQCVGCHSLAPGRHIAGPSLHALIGRPAGSLEGFGYSPVLEAADFVWNAEALDAFLAEPDAFLPGNRMVFWGLDEGPRQAIIHFLDALSAETEP